MAEEPIMDPSQAMMQGAMGIPAQEPEMLDQGDSTPEEQAGRGSDTLLGHLTPGEIVVPKEIIDNEIAMRKLKSLFDKYEVDINQFTVGHEANSINPETGNPEFGFFKFIQKNWDYVRGKRQKQKATQAATKAAAQQAAAHKARIDAMIAKFNKQMDESKAAFTAESKLKRAEFAATSMIGKKQFDTKLSDVKKEAAGLDARPGVVDAGKSQGTRAAGAWRRRRKRVKRIMKRRPQ